MIVTGQARPPADRPRRYYTGAARTAAVQPVVDDALANGGTVSVALVRQTAFKIGRSEQQVRRMAREILTELERGGAQSDADDLLPLPRDFLLFAASLGGNIAVAHAEYPWSGVKPHYATVLRRLDRIDTCLRDVLRQGEAAIDKYLATGVIEWQRVNERWTSDEMHIPVPCRGPRGQRIDNLHLLTYLDECSRLAVMPNCNVGLHDGLTAAATFARAVVGRVIDDVWIHGSPDQLFTDNAEQLRGVHVTKAVAATRLTSQGFASPYTPQEKGKIERYHHTLKYKYLIGIAGFLRGPVRTVVEDRIAADGTRSKERVERAYSQLPIDQLPDARDVIGGTYGIVNAYNRTHVHSSLGMTPLKKYEQDTSLRLEFAPELFWDSAIPTPHGWYIVEKRGVSIDSGWYDAPVLETRRRARVAVRFLPGPEPIFLVGDANGALGVLSRDREEPQRQRVARANRNHERQAWVRRLLTDGAARQQAETVTGLDDPVVATRGTRARRARPSSASDEQLLELSRS